MNGVTGRGVGRGDLRFVRGDTERFGARCWSLDPDTGTRTPTDLTGWSGEIELTSPDGAESYGRIPCAEMTADGYALATTRFEEPAWPASRAHGRWRCRVTSPDGNTVTTVAWGYFIVI